MGYCKKIYDRYDGVIAVSDALYKILLNVKLVDKKRLHCIYDILNEDLVRKQAIEKFGGEIPNKSVITLTTVARLIASNKGQDICLEAAKILKNKGYKFQWFFVGDGPSRQELEASAISLGIKNEARFVGMQPNPYPYIKAADIYVQSSRFEGFGLTITEAKILGRAIVSTNFPTAFNQLEDGKNGSIVEMTAESIASGIEKLLKDESLRQQLMNATTKEVNTTAMAESKKVMDIIMS